MYDKYDDELLVRCNLDIPNGCSFSGRANTSNSGRAHDFTLAIIATIEFSSMSEALNLSGDKAVPW